MKIIASFDDCSEEDLKIAELMAEHNIKTIFYWPAYPEQVNEPKGRKSLDMKHRQEIAEEFEVGSHTLTHPLLTRISKDAAWHEISESKEVLRNMYNQPIKSFCYPRGYSNPDLQKMVEFAGYETARGVNVGSIFESENPYYQQTTVHLAPRKEYGDNTWLQYALEMLEKAIETPGSAYHLFGHGWEISKYDGWHDFETLLGAIDGAHSEL